MGSVVGGVRVGCFRPGCGLLGTPRRAGCAGAIARPVAFPPGLAESTAEPAPGLLVTADRRPLAGPPAGAVAVPDPVVVAAAGGRLEAVWVKELGGVTWRASGAGRYVKWARWAAAWTCSSRPSGCSGPAGSHLSLPCSTQVPTVTAVGW